jgi:hypothetical protein
MINQTTVLFGVIRYEFRMQIRRRSLWIAMLLVGLLQIAIYAPQANRIINIYIHLPLIQTVAELASMINFLLPTVFGCLIADRLPRDRHTKVEELFITMPGAWGMRLLGKYLGSMSATLIPLLIFYGLGVGFIFDLTGNIQTLPIALTALLLIILPGILFISAFSIACPAFMWVPLYQFCFIGYWFWGTLLNPHMGIPTLSGTILAPGGHLVEVSIFQLKNSQSATLLQGIENISILVIVPALVLLVLWYIVKRQQKQQ